jgi:hypothetical protein
MLLWGLWWLLWTLANFLLAILQVLVGAFGRDVLDHVWWWWWWRGTIDRIIVYD